jgi:thiol-disulfide isomerase/thioredoxin
MAGITYFIQAGGKVATRTQSDPYALKEREVYRFPDLAVLPAKSELGGVVLDDRGEPAVNFRFYAESAGFSPMSGIEPRERYDYSRTGDKGEFHLPHVLEKEPIAVWVIAQDNTARIWTKLTPGSKDLRLKMAEARKMTLPDGWEKYSLVNSIAAEDTAVPGGVVKFRLPDLEGRMVSLEDAEFRGKVGLVNIWGSWCGNCQLELPHLVELQKKYGARGLAIIGVAFEREEDPAIMRQKVRDAMGRFGLDYKVVIGGTTEKGNVPKAVEGIEDFRGYPTTLYVGKDGKVREVQVAFHGPTPASTQWQVEQMERMIETLLAE